MTAEERESGGAADRPAGPEASSAEGADTTPVGASPPRGDEGEGAEGTIPGAAPESMPPLEADEAVPGLRTRGLRYQIRRLYDWVLHWADTPYGTPALFVIAFAESSFFPIPPDPLLLALCLGAPRRSLRFAGVATLASVVGGMAGYAIGAGAWGATQDWFFTYVPGVTPEAFGRVSALFDRWGFWAVFIAGFTPIPYKVFTLSSGVFGINFGVFVLASALSRGARFFIVAALVYRFGPPIERFIDRHFDRLVIVFSVLLVGGFLAIELLF